MRSMVRTLRCNVNPFVRNHPQRLLLGLKQPIETLPQQIEASVGYTVAAEETVPFRHAKEKDAK